MKIVLAIYSVILVLVFNYFLYQWRFNGLAIETMNEIAIYSCFGALIWLLVFAIDQLRN